MLVRLSFAAVACLLSMAWPAAAQVVSITHDKALAGGVTSGDGPGYPIIIDNPGSYRLDSDLYPGAVPYGIYVGSPNVTLDFNGFRLFGGGSTIHGIVSYQPGARIGNGTITQVQGYGIFAPGESWTIESMKVLGSGSDGILCGDLCKVKKGNISRGGGAGVRSGKASLVESSIISFNGGTGIVMGGGMVLGNVIFSNGGIAIQNTTPPAGADLGFGNNTIFGHAAPQTFAATPLTPNACSPAC